MTTTQVDTTILSLENVRRTFVGVTAVDELSLNVPAGWRGLISLPATMTCTRSSPRPSGI